MIGQMRRNLPARGPKRFDLPLRDRLKTPGGRVTRVPNRAKLAEKVRDSCNSSLRTQGFETISLTPALSPRERENRRPSVGATGRCHSSRDTRWLFPLPEGEGQGEGETGVRIRRRSKIKTTSRVSLVVKYSNIAPMLSSLCPLTPALSPGERENHRPSVGATGRCRSSRDWRMLCPLPEGEGQGEGEQKVRR